MTLKKLRSAALALAILSPMIPAQAAWAQDCGLAPEPILALNYGSRYTADSENRADLDEEGSAAVDEALDPVDTFLRDLTRIANDVPLEDARDARLSADCVLSQIATWAEAGAMGDLQSVNAQLTVGSRIAGFGLVLLQVLPYTSNTSYLRDIRPWLAGLMADQMLFWEEEAPPGAKRGNLRAWSALAGATVGVVTNDPIIESWAVASTAYVMCTAGEDGSLPQEMSRGKWALHYQLHAIAPLTVTAALLAREGVDLTGHCNYALQRIVDFAIEDLNNAGAASEAITGKPQSFFDGTRELKNWQLAWLEAYGTVQYDPKLQAMTDSLRPLSYSKLGGDQTLIWSGLQF